MNEAPESHGPPGATVAGFAFSGVRSDFERLVMRGALLQLVTLGFYRFWLTTDMRRHLWSHTSVGGDPLEYTGTAKELLIGFLFAMAILVPIYLIYFFIGLEAERLQAFASFPLVIFFYLFAQFAIYRARRYRVTRTVWRGVRFWMTGSAWSYAWRAGLWSLLVIITLGLALPWYQAALERYKMRHSFYGDLPGGFDGTGEELFQRVGWLWLTAVVTLLVISVLSAVFPPGAVLLAVPAIVASPFGYAEYKAIAWRWWVDGIRFGDVSFESKLSTGALVGVYWKVIGWAVLLVGVLFVWFRAVVDLLWPVAGRAGETPVVFQHPSVLIALALGYLVAGVMFGFVMRLYLTRDVWSRIASSAVVHNLAAADNVAAQGEATGALGEGLADSLDVGGF